MSFTYFEGPESEMSHLTENAVTCVLCGRSERGFRLKFADRERLDAAARQTGYGCAECLRAGRFEFFHITEVGYLLSSSRGTASPELDLPLPPPDFPETAIAELRRTPAYPSWQEENWLVHCDDFMVYLGSWAPADFHRHAADGDGRSLFLAMTDPPQSELWDLAARDRGEEHPTDWYATYYAFRCRHCNRLRGYWDSP